MEEVCQQQTVRQRSSIIHLHFKLKSQEDVQRKIYNTSSSHRQYQLTSRYRTLTHVSPRLDVNGKDKVQNMPKWKHALLSYEGFDNHHMLALECTEDVFRIWLDPFLHRRVCSNQPLHLHKCH